MAVVVALSVEMLTFAPQSSRADEIMAAMNKAAASMGVKAKQTSAYRGGSDLLMLWGPGHPARVSAMDRQRIAGGHSIAWDLAYWHRDRKVRVSIDAAHPQAWVMRGKWPGNRLYRDRIVVADTWNPDGPVIVAGLGDKARVQYGAGAVDAWEALMMAEAKARGLTVRYRAKPKGGESGSIEQALHGASTLITWHSNVAVDAIRMGIPAICRDGAAAAVCASAWPDGQPHPLDPSVRERFLVNLAWFQWAPSEAKECWRFLTELLA